MRSEGQDVFAPDDDTVNVEEYPEVGRGTPAHLPQSGELRWKKEYALSRAIHQLNYILLTFHLHESV